jgi:gliding motility-associated-like protein
MKAFRFSIFILLLFYSIIPLAAQNLEITNVTTTPATCSDGTDGTISFDIVGGVAPYRWYIYEGVGFPVDFGWTATPSRVTSFGRRKLAVYLIGVKDTAETSVYMLASVEGPDPILITSYSSTDITCSNDNDGIINVTATGETGSHMFDLAGPVTGSNPSGTFTNLPGGTYTVTARDAGTCTTMDVTPGITIINPSPIGVTVDQVNHETCNGENSGSISITPTGGIPNYSVAWTGPNGFTASTEDISGLEAGWYSLIITDSHGCSQAFPDHVEITENPPITVTFAVTDVNCGPPLPSSDGAIDATVTGGSGTYTYAWDGPGGFTANTQDISGLLPGSYILEVTDDAGCVQSMPPQMVNAPPELTASTTQVNNSCYGEFNGSIDLSVSGGRTPYTFAWTGPNGFFASDEDISGLEAGAYSVTIGYPTGCSVLFTNIATITEPPEIQVSSVKTDISCGGLSDGTIDITVSGGQTPYTFAWTGPSGFTSTQEDLSGLGPGAYSLTVTDANSCAMSFADIATIMEPSSVVATYVSHVDVLCNGDASGSIEIDVSGGIAPYAYAWTNSAGTTVSVLQDPVDLPADTYSLQITDANSCVFSFPDLATISEPPPLLADLSKTDVSCFGDGNGSITITASGGAGGYEYSRDGSSYQASASFGSLGPGLYTIWTRDANLCIVSDTISILEPSEIIIQSETATYLCPGPALGEISINVVSGGTAPYEYSINGGADFYASDLFSNLPPGTYQTVVRDATGCTKNGNLNVLAEPPPFQISSYSQDNITTCFDSAEGRIQVTATGGTGSIRYSLDGDPPVSSGDFQNLPAGTYVISLIDDNSCTHDTTVEILAPPVLSIDNISVTDVSFCGGYTNGALQVSASGGTGLLEFSLDDVSYQTSSSFTNLGAGDYTIWVRDANGCTVTSSATIDEPPPVMASVTKTDVQYGSLGSIIISAVSGGTSPYEFSINGFAGPFTTDTSYSDLGPSTYHVIVRDLNGCIYEETVQILDVLPLDMVLNVSHVSCYGANDGSIEFVPQDAEGAVQYSIDDGASFGSNPLFENLPGDSTYQLVALDAAGKLFINSVYITEPAEILFSDTVSFAQCNAFSPTGSINITVSGGAGGFTYLWSDGSTDEDRNNILAGSYDLLISDANNCTRNENIIVGSEVTVDVDAGEDVSICKGESIQLQGSGTGSPSWDPSPYLTDLNILDPVVSGLETTSSFVLTISETASPYGCYNKDTVTVILFPDMGLQVIEDTFVIKGYSVRLETSGGPFDQYIWEPQTGLDNTSVPDPVATPLEPTRYYVFATNSYGCEEVDSVFVDVIEDVNAYNVFTPNGDGINDYFEIRNAERFPEMLVEVYNRWGHQLYSNVGYDSGSRWDGTTSNGKEVPVGTYYYILVPFPGAKPISGNVTIIR